MALLPDEGKLTGEVKDIRYINRIDIKFSWLSFSYYNNTLYIAVKLFGNWYRFLHNFYNKTTIWYRVIHHKDANSMARIYFRYNENDGASGLIVRR